MNKILIDIKQIKTTSITWEQINKRPQLINAIKVIATLKAQEYILRRLLAAKLKVIEEIEEHEKNELKVEEEEMKDTATENNFQNDGKNSPTESFFITDFPQKFNQLGSQFLGRTLTNVHYIKL